MPLGFSRARAGRGRQLACGHRCYQKGDEGNPVERIVDRKRSNGREKEEVEAEHSCYGSRDARAEAILRCGGQNDQQETQRNGRRIRAARIVLYSAVTAAMPARAIAYLIQLCRPALFIQ